MAKIVREIVSLRREYEKHYQLDDGRYVAVVRGTPWHYRDPDGQYQDVDPIIVPDEEACGCERRRLPAVAAPLIAARRPVVAAATRAGCEPVPRYWHVLQAPYYALLPRRVTDGYQIHVDGVSVSVVPVDAAPVEGELVDAHTVTYRDVWPSTDLVLEAKEDRLKASIILRDEQSPTEFRFAVAGTRKDVAELAPPFAVDANGQYLPVTWRVDEEGGAEAALLVVALDTTGDVAFPVEIDPTTTVPSPSADAFVTSWRDSEDSNWGSFNLLYVFNGEPGQDYTFIRFSLPTLPAGATFQRAELRLYQVYQRPYYDPREQHGVVVRPVSGSWSETTITYNNMPGVYPGSDVVVFYYSIATGWYTIDVTPIVSRWYAGTLPNYGFRVSGYAVGSQYHFHSRENINAPQLVITYWENSAPNAPILQPRETFDAMEDAVFSWVFSDPDGDRQTAYQLVIQRADDGTTVYDTGKVASSAQQHTVPGGTLQNGLQYRWTVRTWDIYDQVGPYAPEQAFITSARPTVTITDPATDGATVATSEYAVQWSVSDPESKGQSAYRVVLKQGNTVVHDSGQVQSTSAREYLLQGLVNGATYTVEVTAWDGDGMASQPATRTFQVQYTPPPTPDVSVEALEAWVRITIANHNTGAEVQAVSNDVYRRKVGEAGHGIRIATNVPVDGVVYDYAVASGVAYEYRVVAIGSNGTTAASAWVQAPVLKLTGAWIHDPADPANTIRQFRVAADRSESWEPAAETFQFAGRKLPVAEFGEQTDQRVKTAIMVLPDSLADLHALRSLADLRTVLCYRDSAGRRIFGVLGPLNIRDERHGGYTVDLEITAVDYDEAV